MAYKFNIDDLVEIRDPHPYMRKYPRKGKVIGRRWAPMNFSQFKFLPSNYYILLLQDITVLDGQELITSHMKIEFPEKRLKATDALEKRVVDI